MTTKNSSPVFYFLLTILPLLVLMSCSSSKNSVTMVKEPTVSSDTSTKSPELAENEGAAPAGSAFRSLTIGENQPIRSLDPLFAKTFSEMRALQLVYEGLVRLDNQGNVIPAIAKKWTVSNHHQKFRFALRTDIFYQNSSLFSSGRGRKLRASDIKKDFERMAQAGVPSYAAKMFMNIRGFQPYFREQHHVFRSSERQFHDISGIKIPNDSTIIFTLVRPDRHFLQKLASPYAVIYPPGAADGDHFEAVGTGPFKFAERRADSLYIFARSKNDHRGKQPALNRINIITSSHAAVLLNLMKQGYIDIIPALGPQQMAEVSQDNGQLRSSLDQKFHLLKPKGRTASYRMRYNFHALQPESAVVNALSPLLGVSFFSGPPPQAVHLQWLFPSVQSSASADKLSGDYTTDPFIRAFYTMLQSKLERQNVNFKLKKTRVANRTIPLHTYRILAPFDGWQKNNGSNQLLAKFKIDIWALAGKYVHNLSFNRYPWWINLRNVTVSPTYNR